MAIKITKHYFINLSLAVVIFAIGILAIRYYNHYVSHYTDVTINSSVLNESRKVFIRLPVNYDPKRAYSLIIKTDGNFNLDTWDKALTKQAKSEKGDKAILVSIPNLFFTDTRNRDLVPPYARQDVNTQARPENETLIEPNGEADKFLAFIETELLPYLSVKYKLSNNRVLSGFSAGGSFVLYTLHTKPELFNGYFAFSPAAWYDDMTVVNNVEAFLTTKANKIKSPTYLYLSVGGSEHPLMLKAFDNLESALIANPNNNLVWQSAINEGAEHSDNPTLSVSKGLAGYSTFIKNR
ncbi:alpha/beta hydrolase [Pseudoalteromonas sp. Angola-18]|uniref:alpha/beta hydrolase n=1 Tax=Pseudoalteromonas sp. Angola-18 TaxID=3025338 RepID=UPI00235A2C32|nr:alpha/beta hydrolase-fold protein [Pseudoalteromonas sp. Angola-18]MDC9502299.1 alpha/beta hydrolase-fold protein [Pseudoalteromonas sp. Angola-18]